MYTLLGCLSSRRQTGIVYQIHCNLIYPLTARKKSSKRSIPDTEVDYLIHSLQESDSFEVMDSILSTARTVPTSALEPSTVLPRTSLRPRKMNHTMQSFYKSLVASFGSNGTYTCLNKNTIP